MIRCRSGQELQTCHEDLPCQYQDATCIIAPGIDAAGLLAALTGALLALPAYTPGLPRRPTRTSSAGWRHTKPGLVTDGQVHFFPLPHERSGPTTVVIAADGRVWFTEGSGNRIGSMNPDGSAV